MTVTVSVLVSGLDAELRRLGYKDSTLGWYRRCWRRLERFFAARGVEEFSLDMAMAWVDESCGFFEKERSGTLEANDVYLFRVAQMLGDYAVHGAVLRRYSRSVDKLSREGADTVAQFEAWLRSADRAVSTVRTYGTVAGEFVAFSGTRGGVARCDAAAIEDLSSNVDHRSDMDVFVGIDPADDKSSFLSHACACLPLIAMGGIAPPAGTADRTLMVLVKAPIKEVCLIPR